MTKLPVTFSNFANAPKTRIQIFKATGNTVVFGTATPCVLEVDTIFWKKCFIFISSESIVKKSETLVFTFKNAQCNNLQGYNSPI